VPSGVGPFGGRVIRQVGGAVQRVLGEICGFSVYCGRGAGGSGSTGFSSSIASAGMA